LERLLGQLTIAKAPVKSLAAARSPMPAAGQPWRGLMGELIAAAASAERAGAAGRRH
jgi:hypothetical protein